MRKGLLWIGIAILSVAFFILFHRTQDSQVQVKVFRTNLMQEIIHFDPRIADDSVSLQMSSLLFAGLTTLDKGKVELDLAQFYSLSQDQKTYQFVLKESSWSDGSLITAEDFEQSWKQYIQEGFPASLKEMVSMIQHVKVLDEKTLEIQLHYPVAYFLQLLAHPTLFPVHQTMRASRQITPLSIVCSGPYTLIHNDLDKIVLKKNHYFHNRDGLTLDGIHFSKIRDAHTALALFEKGEFDWLGSPLSDLPLDALPQLRQKGLLKSHPLLDTRFLYFNTQEYPFNNVHVRRALTLAINRQAIIDDVLHNEDRPGLGYVPYAQKLEHWHPFFQDGDVIGAREHFKLALEELHLSAEEFPEITLSYNTSDQWRRVMQVIQEQWRQVLGIKVQIQQADWPIHMDKLRRGLYQVARCGRTADFNDSIAFLQQLLSFNAQNFCLWKNERYDEILRKAQMLSSEEERIAYYEQAEQILIDEMPLAPLIFPCAYTIQQDGVQGVEISPLYYAIFTHVQLDLFQKRSIEGP